MFITHSLRRGDFEQTLVPPDLGAVPRVPALSRGDLDLIVKQQSMNGFELKLRLIGSAVSLQNIYIARFQILSTEYLCYFPLTNF